MRKKFKIYYPKDLPCERNRGKQYKPSGKNMVVMNTSGIFFQVNTETYYPSVQRLDQILPRYDVVWGNSDGEEEQEWM